jgi:DNA-3-methyladenine glycosylase
MIHKPVWPTLPREFYLRSDVVQIARELLGKELISCMNGEITSGIICETEAYAGITDKASHAFGDRRTPRTEVMYAEGGTAYVYLCYGIHSLFNVVTNIKEVPHAVLVRGIIPLKGKEIMLRRTGKEKFREDSGIGPGKVSRLLGIHYSHSGLDLTASPNETTTPAIWITDTGFKVTSEMIITRSRIGVEYAGADALLPYRFHVLPASVGV